MDDQKQTNSFFVNRICKMLVQNLLRGLRCQWLGLGKKKRFKGIWARRGLPAGGNACTNDTVRRVGGLQVKGKEQNRQCMQCDRVFLEVYRKGFLNVQMYQEKLRGEGDE